MVRIIVLNCSNDNLLEAPVDNTGAPQTHPSNDGRRRTLTIVGAVVASSVGVFAMVLGTIFVVKKRRRLTVRSYGNFKSLWGVKIPRPRKSLWRAPSFIYSPLDMDAVNKAREERYSPAPSRISLPSELHVSIHDRSWPVKANLIKCVSPDTVPCSPAVASSELYGSLSHSEKDNDGQNVQGSTASAPSAHHHSLRRITLSRGNTDPAGIQPSPGEEDAGGVSKRSEDNIENVR
jgi:hypothetical protein